YAAVSRPEKEIKSSGAGITGSCEPPCGEKRKFFVSVYYCHRQGPIKDLCLRSMGIWQSFPR
ncbi:hypothetical protein STEG23_023181, partial [Scotinomys teguina]